MEGVNWPSGQGVVLGKEVAEDFIVGEPAVGKQGDDAWDKLDELAVVGKETSRNVLHAVALDGDQLVIAEQVHDAGDNHAHFFGKIRDGQYWLICREHIMCGWNRTHIHAVYPGYLASTESGTPYLLA